MNIKDIAQQIDLTGACSCERERMAEHLRRELAEPGPTIGLRALEAASTVMNRLVSGSRTVRKLVRAKTLGELYGKR